MEEDEEDSEDWLTTYADAITLLMAFFIMLVSFSKVDIPLFEDVAAGIKEEIGGQTASDRPIFALHSKIQAVVDSSSEMPPGAVQVGFDEEGIVIDFLSGSFFRHGSTELTDVARTVLKRVRNELSVPPYDIYHIDVEGHTDDVPVSNERFPSNWELSAFRAAVVLRYLIEIGMEPSFLKAVGFADTKPKVPNVDVLGEPIQANRDKNNRVTIRLHPNL
ncbi:MAG: flagellar motor protein MotB [Alphaproteobacteria bacterium]